MCSVHQLQCFTTNSVTAVCSMSHAGTAGSRSRTWHVYIFFRFRILVTSMEGRTCTKEMVAKLKRVDDQSVISWSNPLSLTHCYSIRFALTAIRSVPRMISSILPVTRKEATVGFTSKLVFQGLYRWGTCIFHLSIAQNWSAMHPISLSKTVHVVP